jgi:hypothetical protein
MPKRSSIEGINDIKKEELTYSVADWRRLPDFLLQKKKSGRTTPKASEDRPLQVLPNFEDDKAW